MSVFDPPEEIISIGYTWKQGNASGGSRELFTSVGNAERRLRQLVDGERRIESPNKVRAWRFADDGWVPLALHWPTDLTLTDSEADQ